MQTHEANRLGDRWRRLLHGKRTAHLEPVDEDSWYVVVDAEFHGPISHAVLVDVLADHPRSDDTPLWSAAHTDEAWSTLRDRPALAAEVAALRKARAGHAGPPHPLAVAVIESSSHQCAQESSETHDEVDVRAGLDAVHRIEANEEPRAVEAAARPGRNVPTRWGWLVAGVALGAAVVTGLITPHAEEVRREPAATIEVSDPACTTVAASAPSVSEPASASASASESASESVSETVSDTVSASEPAPIVSTAPPTVTDRVHPHRATSVVTPIAAVTPAPPVETPAPASPAPAPPPPASPPSLEELVSRAAPTEPAPPPTVAPTAPTRQTPTQSDVVRALDEVHDAIAACTPAHAIATLRLTLRGQTGQVTSVYVDGAFAGTPAGSCIARAAREAHVEPFARPTFALTYPVRL
jgi:hypothetical protein